MISAVDEGRVVGEGAVVSQDLDILAVDGFPLAATVFRPTSAGNGKVVQINGATAVHRHLYRKLARFLAGQGFVVVTYDYRGAGDSLRVPIRRMHARMRDWGTHDLTAVTDWVARTFPALGHRALVHSVGGQILCLSPNVDRFEAVYGVAAQWPAPHVWPRQQRRWLSFFARVVAPAATHAAGYFPGKLFGMGDLPKGIGLEWMRWCAADVYMIDVDGRPMRPYRERLRARTRWLGFTDDLQLAPPAAVRCMAQVYPNAPSEVIIHSPAALGVDAVGHWGFFRSWAQEPLWHQAADWLAES